MPMPISFTPSNGKRSVRRTRSGHYVPQNVGLLHTTHAQRLHPLPPAYQVAVSYTQGKKREYMEDAFAVIKGFEDIPGQGYFAVFDGHGGSDVSSWCKDHFHNVLQDTLYDYYSEPPLKNLHRTFLAFDQMLPAVKGGSTATVAYLRHEDGRGRHVHHPGSVTHYNVLYLANVGDSRAVMCRAGRAVRLTKDDNTTDASERARIEKNGGRINDGYVGGVVNVTRALGDKERTSDGQSIKQWVISDPHLCRVPIMPHDEFLIIASDGLWNSLSDKEAVAIVRSMPDLQTASDELIKLALQDSTDNITVIIIRFGAVKIPGNYSPSSSPEMP